MKGPDPAIRRGVPRHQRQGRRPFDDLLRSRLPDLPCDQAVFLRTRIVALAACMNSGPWDDRFTRRGWSAGPNPSA